MLQGLPKKQIQLEVLLSSPQKYPLVSHLQILKRDSSCGRVFCSLLTGMVRSLTLYSGDWAAFNKFLPHTLISTGSILKHKIH